MEKHVGLQLVSDPLPSPDSHQTHKPAIRRSDALELLEVMRERDILVNFEKLSWAH